MKLSLVIPVHNLEKYIEPLLVSLKYQICDHDEIEPIFICDTCVDRTHELIEEGLRDSYKNLVILDREYRSSGLGRNDGIAVSTGEYIWLLDGDDWLIDNYAFAKIFSFFETYKTEKVVHVGWLSNNYRNSGYLFTVWQWVVCSEYAKRTKFTCRPYDDDVEWVQKLFQNYHIEAARRIADPFYFYNFMRPGSVMTERIKNKQ